VQKLARAKFDESLEVAVNLGIDTRRGDSQARGAAVPPPGAGGLGSIGPFSILYKNDKQLRADQPMLR